MTSKLLALFGLAPSAAQATLPPVFAYLLLLVVGIFAARVVDIVAGLLGSYAYYLRVPGVLCTLLVLHGIYRLAIHRDDQSWGGWIRKVLL